MKIPRNHPHAEKMRQWLDDDSLVVEHYHRFNKEWEVTTNPSWNKEAQYRFKQKTITINGHEVPEPLREAPPRGTDYFVPLFGQIRSLADFYLWDGDSIDRCYLKQGMVHLTKEAAETHAKALLSFTEDKE